MGKPSELTYGIVSECEPGTATGTYRFPDGAFMYLHLVSTNGVDYFFPSHRARKADPVVAFSISLKDRPAKMEEKRRWFSFGRGGR